MKKVELVFPKSFLNDLTKILVQLKMSGYTILEVHSSYGVEHGNTLDFGFSSSQTNLYLFTICDESKANDLIAVLKSPIKEAGGLILSSDVTIY